MLPTLRPGDGLLAVRGGRMRTGQLRVFPPDPTSPSRWLIKRVGEVRGRGRGATFFEACSDNPPARRRRRLAALWLGSGRRFVPRGVDGPRPREVTASFVIGLPRYTRPMGISDKISNKVDDVAGKAKEGVGRASGDKSTEKNEGKLDQASPASRTPARRSKTPSRTDGTAQRAAGNAGRCQESQRRAACPARPAGSPERRSSWAWQGRHRPDRRRVHSLTRRSQSTG